MALATSSPIGLWDVASSFSCVLGVHAGVRSYVDVLLLEMMLLKKHLLSAVVCTWGIRIVGDDAINSFLFVHLFLYL